MYTNAVARIGYCEKVKEADLMVKNAYAPIRVARIEKGNTTIMYPVVYGLSNTTAQNHMNSLIRSVVSELVEAQHAEQDPAPYFQEMLGTFEVKNNQRGILSIVFTNYAYAPKHAHGLNLAKSLTFSIDNGKLYNLNNLFRSDINYESYLSLLIEKQASIRNIPLLNDKINVRKNQDFYLADQTLVIYFQAYEIAPGYAGLPTFPLPAYSLEPILNQDGPLATLSSGI
ncbi:DUF3298 domain-containing protein [Aciduricibacillus chroicocephali]|uniref:DUF3298 domain-containing protein n=1 Tax=Aciduricibacillus chroicocephali TaxID=3054939 RepID=A0ABY9KWC2_9BACI|nr:DUF3298 domain-containing protein [Bacillaceae bacterium 44XB]